MTNQPSAEALRECPFCGSSWVVMHAPANGSANSMACRACNAHGPLAASFADEQTVAAWNTRTPDPSTAALVEALEPFVEAADNLEDDERDTGSLWESPEAMMLTVADLRRAKAAWATFHASNPATAQVAGEGE